MESMVERFVRYTSINTRSNEESTTIPSTQTQVDFATNVLVPDLKAIGLDEVIYNRENGFVIGTLNANTDEKHLRLALSLIWIRFPISVTMQSHRWSQKITMEESSLSAQAAEPFPRKCSRILLHLPGVP